MVSIVSSICQEGGRGSGVAGEEEEGFSGVGEVVEVGLEEGETAAEAAPESGKGEVITNCSTFSN